MLLRIWSHPSHPEWVFSGTRGVMIAMVLSHDAIFPSKCIFFFNAIKIFAQMLQLQAKTSSPQAWEREHLPLKYKIFPQPQINCKKPSATMQ